MLEFPKNLSARYNSLMSVETANHIFREERDYEFILTKLGTLILDHNLEKIIGLRLLHRHNDIEPDSAMVEYLERLADGRNALVTKKTTIRTVSDVIPSVWTCSKLGEIEPIEYADAQLFRVGKEFFEMNRLFYIEFHNLASLYAVDDIICLSLLNDSLAYDKVTQTLSESTEPSRFANVVVVKYKRDLNPTTHIETTWEFSRDVNMACARNCCNNCVMRSPGHDVAHKHSFHAMDD